MKLRLAALLVALSIARPAVAHRLDEYLQAIQVSLRPDGVSAELRLTPGAAVAEGIIANIDRDRDGSISAAESAAYAESVVKSLVLEVDGTPQPVTLVSGKFPALAEMRRGEGAIHIGAAVKLPASSGYHQLKLVNRHRTDISVYLMNALVPANPRVAITGQSRDLLQREYSVNYRIAESESRGEKASAFLPALLGIALAGAGFGLVRRVR